MSEIERPAWNDQPGWEMLYTLLRDRGREIERWKKATGREEPEQVTYTQEEAKFWNDKADQYITDVHDSRHAALWLYCAVVNKGQRQIALDKWPWLATEFSVP